MKKKAILMVLLLTLITGSAMSSQLVHGTIADARTEALQPLAAVWGSQKKWANQYWYAYGQAYNSPTWPWQGILYSDGFQVDSYAYYSFTLPVPPSSISYLDVGIYGKAVSGNGLDIYVWNWATSSWDFVATTPTVEGHKYWGVNPTNHVQGSSYEYRLRVYADDFVGNDDRYDMWYIDTYYYYTPPPYSVTIWSWCIEGWTHVPITMDGVATGYSTPHTFTVTGTHTFTVPSTDALGYTFYEWSTGSTSTTITVSVAGTYTARYGGTITVTSPNGGESWVRGTTHTITWTKSGSPGENVKIELLKGGVLNKVIVASTANDGSYSWNIPSGQTAGTDYKIRITSTSKSTITDSSNNNFAIVAVTGGITVTVPNGGEKWVRGTTHTITWTKSGSPGANVKIELLKGGVLNKVIVASTPNDGSFSWTISSTQTLGTDYKIKITSTTTPAITDSSNSNFAIVAGTLTVTSPNGGESWKRGTTHTITWTKSGSPGANVKIELLKGGVLNTVIVASTTNDGSYSWTIPSGQTAGTDYKIRITSTTYPSIKDTSNNNFKITT